MITETQRCSKKNLGSPDTVLDCGHGRMEFAAVEDTSIARVILEPGWRWTEHIKPAMNTESCQAAHHQFVISGRMRVVMDDGSQIDLEPGDFAHIPPGHDAWVVGNEPFVAVDFAPDMKPYGQFKGECH